MLMPSELEAAATAAALLCSLARSFQPTKTQSETRQAVVGVKADDEAQQVHLPYIT